MVCGVWLWAVKLPLLLEAKEELLEDGRVFGFDERVREVAFGHGCKGRNLRVRSLKFSLLKPKRRVLPCMALKLETKINR